MRTELVLFDVDGTLVEPFTETLLPGVEAYFGLPAVPPFALVSNQGGVGLRRWMELEGFGEPEAYPTQRDVELRLARLAARLGQYVAPGNLSAQVCPVFLSFRYVSRKGHVSPLPPEGRGDVRWHEYWRKPKPGMLRAAIARFGVMPSATLMVGDRDEDRAAAEAVGAAFMQAEEFFARRLGAQTPLAGAAETERSVE
jgi:phosphoglycolate phosphatase-like HAD superfamily hydrolase